MKITIANGEEYVELEADGPYSPDVFTDLANRAVDAYRRAFDPNTTPSG